MPQDTVTSLLIVHQGAIGDFILSLPAIEVLHRAHPQARFTFLAHHHILEIINARPYVHRVLDCGSSHWAPLYLPNGSLVTNNLKSLLPVDRIFVFGRSSSQIVADNLAMILGKPSYRLDPFPDPGLGLGVAEYQCRQLETLGFEALPPPAAVIAPAQTDLHEARSFLFRTLDSNDRLVMLHPGSGSQDKLWAPIGWLDLIHRFITQQNLRLALVQGPADQQIAKHLRRQLENMPIISIENYRLGKLAALLSHASLYVGNDSGITHLAGACGVPTIALFGPTDPLIWGPRGAKVGVIRWNADKSSVDTALLSGQKSTPPVETDKIWALANEWLELEE